MSNTGSSCSQPVQVSPHFINLCLYKCDLRAAGGASVSVCTGTLERRARAERICTLKLLHVCRLSPHWCLQEVVPPPPEGSFIYPRARDNKQTD